VFTLNLLGLGLGLGSGLGSELGSGLWLGLGLVGVPVSVLDQGLRGLTLYPTNRKAADNYL